MKLPRIRLTYANVTSTLALTLALGMGGAYAADKLIGTDDIEKNAITSKLIDNDQIKTKDLKDNKAVKGVDVKDASLDGADVLDGGLTTADLADGAVDGAKVLDGSLAAGDLVAQEKFHVLNTAGEPPLGNGGQGDCVWTSAQADLPQLNPPGYRIDRFGTVTMTGVVATIEVAGAGDEECGATDPGEPDDGVEDAVIFTLPAAYRPARTLVFPNTASGLVIVGNETLTQGSVSLPPGTVFTRDGLAALDAVSYPAAGAGVVSARAPASGAEIPALDDLLGD